jgi:hypothetical protein
MPNRSASPKHWNPTFISRWPEVFSRLAELPAFSALSEVSPDASESGFCPIHGGDSGEAFHVYPDFAETGGCVCNSCGSFASGTAFLAAFAATKGVSRDSLAETLEGVAESLGLSVPERAERFALNEWLSAFDKDCVVRYLSSRGIPDLREETLPTALRGIWRNADGSRDPANPLPQVRILVCKEGQPLSAYRIFLAPDGRGKNSEVSSPKRFYRASHRHLFRGAYFDLSTSVGDGSRLYLGEGMETMMAVRAITGGTGRYHALGGAAGQFGSAYVPDGVTDIHLCADNDHTRAKAEASRDELVSRGYSVTLHLPPEGAGKDWLDALNSLGLARAADAFADAAAVAAQPAGSVPVDAAATSEPDSPTSSVTYETLETGGLAHLNLDIPDAELFAALDTLLPRFCRSTWFLHLRLPNPYPCKVEGSGIQPLTPDDLAASISEKVAFYQETRDGVRFQATPKGRVANWFVSAQARGLFDAALRPLVDVLLRPSIVHYVESSEENPAGVSRYRFLCREGYDEASRFYLEPSEFDVAAVAAAEALLEDCTSTDAVEDFGPYLRGDLRRNPEGFGLSEGTPDAPPLIRYARLAVLRTLSAVLEDFHFATPSDYANAVSLFLAPVLSPACPNLPLFLIQAPARGAGKTTLAHAFCQFWGGFLQIAAPDDEAEMEKRLATSFTTGKHLVLLDNLNRLDSPSLTNLLTSQRTFEVRKLGTNESIPMPSGFLILGTGNNPSIQHELARRIVFIDIDPPRDAVTSAIAFAHPDLPGWVQEPENQLRLRQAIYLCLLIWERMGFPRFETGELPLFGTVSGTYRPKLESFNELAQLASGFLHLFFPGKLYELLFQNQGKYLDSDSETDEITQFVGAWARMAPDLPTCEGPGGWVPVSSLLTLAERIQAPANVLEYRRTEAGQQQRMGQWLSRLSNRRFQLDSGSWRIMRNPGMLWFRTEMDERKRTRAYRLEPC